jgi:hypothetical protein
MLLALSLREYMIGSGSLLCAWTACLLATAAANATADEPRQPSPSAPPQALIYLTPLVQVEASTAYDPQGPDLAARQAVNQQGVLEANVVNIRNGAVFLEFAPPAPAYRPARQAAR